MSDASSFSGMDARIETLERQIRSLRRLLFVALAGVVAAFGAGAAGAAQRTLSFADSSGHTRVKIDAGGVQMYDAAGNRRILMGFNSSGKPSFYLEDAHGNYPLGAYISNENQPVFRLADEHDKARAYFGLTADSHQPRIEFDDAQENERLYVGLTNQATGLVRSFTVAGKDQSSLEDDKLTITDDNGNERVYLGTSDSDDGIFELYDSNSRQRAYAGIYTDGAAGFQSYDTNGTATWNSTWKP